MEGPMPPSANSEAYTLVTVPIDPMSTTLSIRKHNTGTTTTATCI